MASVCLSEHAAAPLDLVESIRTVPLLHVVRRLGGQVAAPVGVPGVLDQRRADLLSYNVRMRVGVGLGLSAGVRVEVAIGSSVTFLTRKSSPTIARKPKYTSVGSREIDAIRPSLPSPLLASVSTTSET